MKIGRNWFRTRFFENKKVLKSPDLRRWDWCDAERKGTRKILIGPDPISSSRFLGFPLSFWQKWKKQFSSKSRDFDFLFFSVSVSLFNFLIFSLFSMEFVVDKKIWGGKNREKVQMSQYLNMIVQYFDFPNETKSSHDFRKSKGEVNNLFAVVFRLFSLPRKSWEYYYRPWNSELQFSNKTFGLISKM